MTLQNIKYFPRQIYRTLYEKDGPKNPQTFTDFSEATFRELNKENNGIYFSPQSYSGNSNKKEDLAKINTLFADLDIAKNGDGQEQSAIEEKKNTLFSALQALPLPPSTVVSTRNGLQPYWYVGDINDVEKSTISRCENVIKGISSWAIEFGSLGDHVYDIVHLLRVPGFDHCKNEPYLITVLGGNNRTYNIAEIESAFPYVVPVSATTSTSLSAARIQEVREGSLIDQVNRLDVRGVVVRVWESIGHTASFDKDNHLVVDNVLTATFVNRDGENFIATTSAEFPANGNAVTYTAETLKITPKEAFRWIVEKFELSDHGGALLHKGTNEKIQTSIIDKNEEEMGTILTRLSEVRKEKIQWLWKDRIALGKLSLIAGNPGITKSLFALTIAAHVSRGKPWFIDESECPEGDVIILSAEDDAADTLVPRLEAAGANLKRIQSLEMVRVPTKDGVSERVFSLKRDIDALREALDKNPEVKLIIIDPISSYLDGADSHANADVRGLISPLAKLASKYKVAVVMISHLNKNSAETNALYRVTGSLAFVAIARTAFLVVKDSEDKDRRLMLELKNNIAKSTPGIAWRIQETKDEIPYIVCEDGFIADSADDALSATLSANDSQESEEITFLKEELKDGEKGAYEMTKEAKKIGITEHPLRDARRKLGIVSRKKGYGGVWMWGLPSKGVAPLNDVIFEESVAFGQNKSGLDIPQQLLLPPPIKIPPKPADDINF
jgi:RecA-family ATPase